MKVTRYYRPLLAGVALALLALSLQHLAAGVVAVTGTTPTHAWLMAIGIDGAMVAVELAALAGVRGRWVLGILVAACTLSAGFNCLGFLEHAHGVLGQVLGISLGIFIPSTVYGLTDTLTRTRPRVKRVTKRRK